MNKSKNIEPIIVKLTKKKALYLCESFEGYVLEFETGCNIPSVKCPLNKFFMELKKNAKRK
jgi:hypothetical protein